MLFSVTQIAVPPGKVNGALEILAKSAAGSVLGEDLRGCWYSELGRLNRLLLIHGHRDAAAATAAIDGALRAGDLFGLSEIATAVEIETYSLFPNVQFLAAGNVGPIFEVRIYQLRKGGLSATFDAWSKVLAARTRLSPLATVMYGVSGNLPRFLHIWPYASLDARMTIREQAVKDGIWPPPGGLPHIETMQSEIYLPAAFSPLR
jgi:hypothetical protein